MSFENVECKFGACQERPRYNRNVREVIAFSLRTHSHALPDNNFVDS